jgi:hypothetical protein
MRAVNGAEVTCFWCTVQRVGVTMGVCVSVMVGLRVGVVG